MTTVYRTLPIPLIMIPFGVIAQQYKIVDKASDCTCWLVTILMGTNDFEAFSSFCLSRCLPFYGNILPRANIGLRNHHVRSFLSFFCFVNTLLLPFRKEMTTCSICTTSYRPMLQSSLQTLPFLSAVW